MYPVEQSNIHTSVQQRHQAGKHLLIFESMKPVLKLQWRPRMGSQVTLAPIYILKQIIKNNNVIPSSFYVYVKETSEL